MGIWGEKKRKIDEAVICEIRTFFRFPEHCLVLLFLVNVFNVFYQLKEGNLKIKKIALRNPNLFSLSFP